MKDPFKNIFIQLSAQLFYTFFFPFSFFISFQLNSASSTPLSLSTTNQSAIAKNHSRDINVILQYYVIIVKEFIKFPAWILNNNQNATKWKENNSYLFYRNKNIKDKAFYFWQASDTKVIQFIIDEKVIDF